ncbi:hypothetical protein EDD37DRAFT_16886 [Exophiala viscosa]|uniref:uncharacterized protein n=1 Tax=Exophiala viscosa TaxID=2486360 RepID=UPI002198BE4C|nr:hypothetical protein EDD37DRAFT_16886 [Exophiala viscosa]
MANTSARQTAALMALRDARQIAQWTPVNKPRDEHEMTRPEENNAAGGETRLLDVNPLLENVERHPRDHERALREARQRLDAIDNRPLSFAKSLFWLFVGHLIARLLVLGLQAFITVGLPAWVDFLRGIILLVVSFLWINVSPILCFAGGMIAIYGVNALSRRLTRLTGGTPLGAAMD